MARKSTNEYAPTRVSPPGETLADILEERGLTQAELARRTGRPVKTINEIIKGKAMIVPETAIQLERALGPSADFWLAREARYREYLARIADEERLRADISWLKELPLKQMIEWSWVPEFTDKAQQVAACLKFFGVSSVDAWRTHCAEPIAAFRMSKASAAKTGAVAAWLRKGQILEAQKECANWSTTKLRASLPDIRALTNEADPNVFLPALRQLLAEAGVSLAIVRQPKGCPASGATLFKGKDRAVLILSFRFLADDQFWFSVFHEIGHLLLHGKKAGTIVEGLGVSNDLEREADEFASGVIIPEAHEQELAEIRCTKASILAFAEQIGIGPGLVVGRLQHDLRLRFDRCNDLKARYQWAKQ